MTARIFDVWRHRTRKLKIKTYAIYLAYKDPRVPWYAKLLIICIFGYLFSPIDKFLDSIPIIGYLEHLILLPIGVALAFKKMIPPAVLIDCRQKARIAVNEKNPTNWVDGSIMIFISFLFASVIIIFTIWIMKDWNGVLKWWFGWFMRMTKWPNHMPVHSGFYAGDSGHQVSSVGNPFAY
jgi:uncharacterized membrane protein YkvA (DUF1232 family)